MDGSLDLATTEGTKSNRDRRAKFVELAQRRTVNAIKAIRVIGKLGNKSAYEYDDSDVKKIISSLSKEIDALKARLGQKTSKAEVEFKL
jgi:ribosomal protein L7/L12